MNHTRDEGGSGQSDVREVGEKGLTEPECSLKELPTD